MDDIDEKHQMPSLTKHMPQLQSVSGGSTIKLCLNGFAWFTPCLPHVQPSWAPDTKADSALQGPGVTCGSGRDQLRRPTEGEILSS